MPYLSGCATKESELASGGGPTGSQPLVPGVEVRPTTTADGPAIEAMFARCSLESRYARFLAPLSTFPPDHLAQVLNPARGDEAWVGVKSNDPTTVVALGSWSRAGTASELALIVEDSFQRRGIGTAFVGIAVERARSAGVSRFTALVLTESRHVLRMLRSELGPFSGQVEGHVIRLVMTSWV